MTEAVIDASALLALLNNEKGADVVVDTLPGAIISAVNVSEVVAKLNVLGMPENLIRQALSPLGLDVRPFDEVQAFQTGLLRISTQKVGLSLGDRACLSLSKELGVMALTADKTWAGIPLGVKVKVIR